MSTTNTEAQAPALEVDGAPAATPARDVKLTWGQRGIVLLATLGGITSAACGYITNFAGLTDYAEKKHWSVPEALPVGLDVAIPTLLMFDYVATVQGARFPFLRWCAWGLTAFTVFAGATAATPPEQDMEWSTVALKGIMPVLGVIMVEFARLWALHKRNLLEKTDRDSIPLARWIAAPWPTLLMKRQMVLWNETSYPRAIAREAALLYSQSLLETKYGGDWKKTAPVSLRYRLKRGQLPSKVVAAIKSSVEHNNEDWQPAVENWIKADLWRTREMFGDRDTDQSPDGDSEPEGQTPPNQNRENGNRRNGRSGTGARPKRTARQGNGTAKNETGTNGSRRVGRPPRSEEDEAALRGAAVAFVAEHFQEHGERPTTKELRDKLGVGQSKACALLRELSAGAPTMPAEDGFGPGGR